MNKYLVVLLFLVFGRYILSAQMTSAEFENAHRTSRLSDPLSRYNSGGDEFTIGDSVFYIVNRPLMNIDGYSSIISEEEGGTLGWPVCNLGYRCTWIIKNGFVYLDKVTSTSDVTPSEIERRLYSLIRKKIGDNPNWRIPIWLSGEYLLINKGTTFDYKLRQYYILRLFEGKFIRLEELNLQRKLVKEKGR